jgi:[acyl-carrier-protein] S-malonyltransferase
MSENTVAFVFPGQGSQKVGMLADAHQQFQSVRDTFEEASQALGYDMWDLIQNGEQEALNLTETTQPVLLSSSVALWRAWQELVRQRGAFMQTAVPVGEGAMAAIIGLDDEAINRICTEVSGSSGAVVSAVNFNSPGQVVIAGHTGAVDTAIEALKEAGAKRAMPLPVSAPFHTELMKPAGERLAEAIANIDISTPAVPVVHNVHAETEADPEKIRGLLVEQIYSPVQWTRCVQTIVGQGVGAVVECGPGKVLSGLNRRIDKSLQSYSLEAPDSLVAAVEELK